MSPTPYLYYAADPDAAAEPNAPDPGTALLMPPEGLSTTGNEIDLPMAVNALYFGDESRWPRYEHYHDPIEPDFDVSKVGTKVPLPMRAVVDVDSRAVANFLAQTMYSGWLPQDDVRIPMDVSDADGPHDVRAGDGPKSVSDVYGGQQPYPGGALLPNMTIETNTDESGLLYTSAYKVTPADYSAPYTDAAGTVPYVNPAGCLNPDAAYALNYILDNS